LIDFDECEEGYIDPNNFFYSCNLDQNIYIPKYGSPFYESFYFGFFGHPIELMTDIDDSYFNGDRIETEFDIKLDLQIESLSLMNEDDDKYMIDRNIINNYIETVGK
jgi:hypothetical protein